MTKRGLLCAATLLLLLAGGLPIRADEVHLSAAASLTDVVEEITAEIERTSQLSVVLNFAASSTLARQIVAGAPADVFFSADLEQMHVVERAGLVDPGQRMAVLRNSLVVVVPLDSTTMLAAAPDLLRLRRVVVADPVAAPAGVYARRWLEAQGLWDPLADRIVPTLNVRAALAAVETGAADAGIVYRTDAAIAPRARVALSVPEEDGPEIVFALAPLKRAHPATTALVRALTSPSAATVYERHGFTVIFPR